MLLKHTWLCVRAGHTQNFTCMLEVDLGPSRLTQPVCYGLSAAPDPADVLESQPFLCYFLALASIAGRNKTKTKTVKSSHSDLIVPTQPKLFRTLFPVRRQACHSASVGVRERLPGLCSLIIQLHPRSQLRGRYSKLQPASEPRVRVSLPSCLLSPSMWSYVGSLDFLLFTTAPNSLSWEKVLEFPKHVQLPCISSQRVVCVPHVTPRGTESFEDACDRSQTHKALAALCPPWEVIHHLGQPMPASSSCGCHH